ncbi:MAG: thioredoxin family protein [Deltaproteobacteria bacterium]|nr:thioredoxin family protein [Deltaproteobacteria bacterium]MBW2219015.1 thioredoxin family protein [Deltaproteobacteria bacterium]
MGTKKIDNGKLFERTIKKGVCLVDFNAPWCAPCRAQEPILKKLAANYDGRAVIVETNVDVNIEITQKFNIQNIPTLILFKDGREINRFVGLQTEDELSGAIERET